MSPAIAALQAQIRQLSQEDKAGLLRVLLEELDGPGDDDCDAAWAAEIDARSREIDAGTAECLPADAVLSHIESLLKRK